MIGAINPVEESVRPKVAQDDGDLSYAWDKLGIGELAIDAAESRSLRPCRSYADRRTVEPTECPFSFGASSHARCVECGVVVTVR